MVNLNAPAPVGTELAADIPMRSSVAVPVQQQEQHQHQQHQSSFKSSSSLLLDESPLLVLPSLAAAIGLNEAITLQQIHFWLRHAKNKNIRDGRKWIYRTFEEWGEEFPFWSVRTIKRNFSKLEEMEVLLSANYNKMWSDQTRWYSIDYERLESVIVANSQKRQPQQSNQQSETGVVEPTRTTTRAPSRSLEPVEDDRIVELPPVAVAQQIAAAVIALPSATEIPAQVSAIPIVPTCHYEGKTGSRLGQSGTLDSDKLALSDCDNLSPCYQRIENYIPETTTTCEHEDKPTIDGGQHFPHEQDGQSSSSFAIANSSASGRDSSNRTGRPNKTVSKNSNSETEKREFWNSLNADQKEAITQFVKEASDIRGKPGNLTAMRKVAELTATYGKQWILEAFEAAIMNGEPVTKLTYLEGMLRNCKAEGHSPRQRKGRRAAEKQAAVQHQEDTAAQRRELQARKLAEMRAFTGL